MRDNPGTDGKLNEGRNDSSESQVNNDYGRTPAFPANMSRKKPQNNNSDGQCSSKAEFSKVSCELDVRQLPLVRWFKPFQFMPSALPSPSSPHLQAVPADAFTDFAPFTYDGEVVGE